MGVVQLGVVQMGVAQMGVDPFIGLRWGVPPLPFDLIARFKAHSCRFEEKLVGAHD